MDKEKTHLSIRMDDELHDKFQYVAKYEGRSMSKQVLYLIAGFVRDFEKAHGPITREEMDSALP